MSFRQVNLALPFPPMPAFDVIFLRNVLIYFDVATKRAILQRMHQVLAPGGYLFLGGAETTLGIDDEWERVKVGAATPTGPRTARPSRTSRSADGDRSAAAPLNGRTPHRSRTAQYMNRCT